MGKKMKTKRAAAKRFKVTATGKIKYKKAYLRHLLSNKSKGAKKDKNEPGYVNAADYHNAISCIPYMR
jgi:large subunit ribosomal protein L35